MKVKLRKKSYPSAYSSVKHPPPSLTSTRSQPLSLPVSLSCPEYQTKKLGQSLEVRKLELTGQFDFSFYSHPM